MYSALLLATTVLVHGQNLQCFPSMGDSRWDVAQVASGSPAQALTPNSSVCTCGSYYSSSCCTMSYVKAVAAGPDQIYAGWSFNQCGKIMSSKCRAYMEAQECSYGCDPRLSQRYYNLYNAPANFTSIPVCASYCDAWFDACADDVTCSYNWGTWPTIGTGSSLYICNTTPTDASIVTSSPSGVPFQTCKTFRETFRNSRGLCGNGGSFPSSDAGLWNNAYTYSTASNWFVCARTPLPPPSPHTPLPLHAPMYLNIPLPPPCLLCAHSACAALPPTRTGAAMRLRAQPLAPGRPPRSAVDPWL